MEWYNIKCPDCGYGTELVVGTPTPEESFDLNEDFSHYVPVLCESCKSVITLDLFDKRREAVCPCGGKGRPLQEEELGKIDCPSCGGKRLKVDMVRKD